jgi:uncharacterized protein (UPF0332 family)
MSPNPFAWEDYLSIATILLDDTTAPEAALRSAVSRAYYAAFNIARLYLRENGRLKLLAQPNAHRAVWAELRDSNHPIESSLGHVGFRMRSFRNKADYDDSYPRLHHDATFAISAARNLVVQFAELSFRPPNS